MPPVPNTEPIAAEVDPNIYGKSGDISKHVEGVKAQYDTEEKLAFYAQVRAMVLPTFTLESGTA